MSDGTVAPQVETELNRDIGIIGAIAIGVGTMIAAGIFVLSGLAVSNVVGAIVAETTDRNLTVIGATREGLLQEFVFGAIPVAVGEGTHNTVIMAKRRLGITSELRHWLRWQ